MAAAALAATFAMLGAAGVRMAVADYFFRQETLPATRRALSLEPDSAAYYARLAALLESDPAASTQALRRAVALNPWDSQSWVELGLRAEAAGDLPAAQRDLLRAAAVDRQYFPKWSLVNYYFRRGDSAGFWFWAREAVETAYGDLAPLFNLCWDLTGDGALIERKLDIRKADAEAAYLTYLSARNRVEPMAASARRLMAWNRADDVPVLLAACDRFIADGRAGQALQIWNHLAGTHAIPYRAMRPEAGQSLTNGDFLSFPASQGFDWRLPAVAGVTALPAGPDGLRITFSGDQPESCEVLTQCLPVLANSRYELRFRYLTSGIAPGAGLTWQVTNLTGARILARGASLASNSETGGQLAFLSDPESPLVRLALSYRRVLGTVRIEGSITLRQVSLALLERGPQH